MPKNRLHYNYLFIGKKHVDLTLLSERVFPQIMETLSPLLAYTNIRKAKIHAIQIGNRAYLKFGRPRWELDSLKPILESHRSFKENFSFTCLQAEFPSIESAYKKDETVDIYLSVENDDCWGKVVSDGTCGLFLSLREDIYEKAGEALVNDVLCEINSLFDEVKVLFRKRTWWMYGSIDRIGDAIVSMQSKDEEAALQDVSSSRATDKLYAKYYANWEEVQFG